MSGIIQGLLASLKSAAAVTTDAYFNLVTLLLNTTSTNGAQNNTFLDSSSNGYSITRNPATGPLAPTQGTFTPFSQTGWSNYFPTNTSTSQTTLTSTVTAFGTGNFTIELNYYLIAHGAGNVGQIYEGGTNGIGILVENTNQLRVFQRNGAGTSTTLIASGAGTAITVNAWSFISLVRTGTAANQLNLYINGSLVGTGTSATNYTSTTGYINGRYTGANYFPVICYISNLRVSTTNRSFSTPTTFFTSDASTTLLTCVSNRFINVVNGNALTVLSTSTVEPKAQAFSPFAPTAAYSTTTIGGSGYFNNTDYLTVSGATALAFGTNEFTISGWVYFNAITAGANQTIYDGRPNATAAFHVLLYLVDTTFKLTFFTNGAARIASDSALISGQWYHFALSKDDGTTRMFINGVQQSQTYADTNTYVNGTNRPAIGVSGSTLTTSYLNGYLSGLKVNSSATAGVSSVTVPTAPPTTDSDTQFLLNYINAGIYDATAKVNIETVGTAQVATPPTVKFGTAMLFAAGDYLTVADNPLIRFDSLDFTVEAWVYRSAIGTAHTIASKGSSTTGWVFSINASNQLNWTDTSTQNATTATIPVTTWTYVAAVRTGGNINLYIDGVLRLTFANSTTYSQTSPLTIAAGRTQLNSFIGYIEELRFTKGFARNVTAVPTAPFPVQ